MLGCRGLQKKNVIYLDDVSAAGLAAWDAVPFLSKVIDIAPSIIYVFNQKTQANEYSNRSIGSSLGYSPDEIQDMGEELMPRLIHPDDLPLVFSYFADLQNAADGEVLQLEYRMKNRGGSWTWLLSYDTVFERNALGEVVRHMGVATDITDQKAAEARALAAKTQADAANEELRSFAYSVSHDLKSPSTTLQLLMNELRDHHGAQLDLEALGLVDMSIETLIRMQAVIEDVLCYTRVVGQDMDLQEVGLGTLLVDLCQDLRADIAAKNALVEIGDMPIVTGSALQLGILFQNLIVNAMKFVPPGTTPMIEIDQAPQTDTEYVTITLCDNGIGIAPKDHPRIFNMFERLHTADQYPGTGMGLATCRRIARNHQGDIAVQSNPNGGTTFSVTLPL